MPAVLENGSFAYKCAHTEAELASAGLARWGISDLTYCLQRFPVGKNLTRKLAEGAVDRAYGMWQEVCGLSFRRVDSPTSANVVMSTGRGARAGFDGKFGILAFAYLPQGDEFNGQLSLDWDEDEPWTIDPGDADGIQFETVTGHEGGHTIGLSHNKAPNNLLNAIYNPRISRPQAYDTQDAQSRYGKPRVVVPPTVPNVPPTTPNQTVAVVIQLPDGYIFKGRIPFAQASTFPVGSAILDISN
jgi:hypothetical protein